MASSGWALRVLGVRGGGGGPGSASSPRQPLGVWQRPRGHPAWDSVCGLTGKASPRWVSSPHLRCRIRELGLLTCWQGPPVASQGHREPPELSAVLMAW